MKLKLKVNGNPVEVDLDCFSMGDMIDHEDKIKVITSGVDGLTADESRYRMKLASEVIAKVISDRYPALQWEGVQRALPYGKVSEIFTKLLSGDEAGNGASPSPTAGAGLRSN
jgi:hypothetical protein